MIYKQNDAQNRPQNTLC